MHQCICRLTKYLGCNSNIRQIHSSGILFPGAKWRMSKGLPKFGNEYGPLRESPDYSYPDGRLSPLSRKARERKLNQVEQGKMIIKLLEEVDFAVERAQRMKDEQEEQKRQILREKLKPKGDLLLQD